MDKIYQLTEILLHGKFCNTQIQIWTHLNSINHLGRAQMSLKPMYINTLKILKHHSLSLSFHSLSADLSLTHYALPLLFPQALLFSHKDPFFFHSFPPFLALFLPLTSIFMGLLGGTLFEDFKARREDSSEHSFNPSLGSHFRGR